MKGCTTPLGSMPPTHYEQWCGFFYVPREQTSERAVGRGLWLYVVIQEEQTQFVLIAYKTPGVGATAV